MRFLECHYQPRHVNPRIQDRKEKMFMMVISFTECQQAADKRLLISVMKWLKLGELLCSISI